MVDMQVYLKPTPRFFKQASIGQLYGAMFMPTLSSATDANTLGTYQDVTRYQWGISRKLNSLMFGV